MKKVTKQNTIETWVDQDGDLVLAVDQTKFYLSPNEAKNASGRETLAKGSEWRNNLDVWIYDKYVDLTTENVLFVKNGCVSKSVKLTSEEAQRLVNSIVNMQAVEIKPVAKWGEN